MGYTWEALPEPLKIYTEPEQTRLLRDLEALPPTPEVEGTRRDIGDRLAVIGDPRPGIGVAAGVPDMLWLPVMQEGEISIKVESSRFGRRRTDNEDKAYNFTVKPFFIAKYLTTYAQYQAFVDAEDGYQNLEWWQGMPENHQRQNLREQRTKSPNNPRDSISWYQAVAFTRWLNHCLLGLVIPAPTSVGTGFCLSEISDVKNGVSTWIIGQDCEVRLPTEAEWQWVAQNGRERREYPWGERKSGYANTSESGLGRAIAVGMYPHHLTLLTNKQ